MKRISLAQHLKSIARLAHGAPLQRVDDLDELLLLDGLDLRDAVLMEELLQLLDLHLERVRRTAPVCTRTCLSPRHPTNDDYPAPSPTPSPHAVADHTCSSSNPQPVPRASSDASSRDVQRRAPTASQASKAAAQLTRPTHPASGDASLSPMPARGLNPPRT